MRLYELTEQFLALQELAYDPEGDEQTFQDTMEAFGARSKIRRMVTPRSSWE